MINVILIFSDIPPTFITPSLTTLFPYPPPYSPHTHTQITCVAMDMELSIKAKLNPNGLFNK